MAVMTLTLTSMRCMGCVNGVKALLAEIPGVTPLEVDLASGAVRLDYDAATCDVSMLRQAILDAGYGIAD